MNRPFLLLVTAAMSMLAVAAPVVADDYDELRGNLLRAIPALKIASIESSPIEGLVAVALEDGNALQATPDGRFFVYGDLYEVVGATLANRSEDLRNKRRLAMMADLKESEMVVFSPQEGETKASITVFTDVDCTFCRRLHQEVPELNRLGIEVRYVAYPRMGITEPHTATYKKLVSTWCADNPKLALTQAKAGQQIEEKTCDNPVDAQYALGQAMGVTGTPAILYDDGKLSAGYKQAEQFALILGIPVTSE